MQSCDVHWSPSIMARKIILLWKLYFNKNQYSFLSITFWGYSGSKWIGIFKTNAYHGRSHYDLTSGMLWLTSYPFLYKKQFIIFTNFQVLVNGNLNKTFVSTLYKLIQNNERRLKIIRDLYSPKHSSLSYRSSYKKRLTLSAEKKDKPILVVVMLNVSTYKHCFVKCKAFCALLKDRTRIGFDYHWKWNYFFTSKSTKLKTFRDLYKAQAHGRLVRKRLVCLKNKYINIRNFDPKK